MAPKKYPLDALVRVRERKADDATQALARAIREREAEERKKRAAEQERDRAKAAADAVRTGERRALERGELTAADLAHAHAWEVRAREDQAQADRLVAQAKEREAASVAKEDKTRADLAQRSAERDVVGTHRARFAGRERAVAEAKDEELAGEAWRPRRS